MEQIRIRYRNMTISIYDGCADRMFAECAKRDITPSEYFTRLLAVEFGLDPDMAASGCKKRKPKVALTNHAIVYTDAFDLSKFRAKNYQEIKDNPNRTANDYRSYLVPGATFGDGTPVGPIERRGIRSLMRGFAADYVPIPSDTPTDEENAAYDAAIAELTKGA